MNVIYLYSGKGGVGKSSVCINLAFTLKKLGAKVGVFDADISGPSIPIMVSSIENSPQFMEGMSILPGNFADVKIASVGLNDNELDASFWTGKYLKGLLYQFIFSFDWNVDILLVDLPPGTTDVHKEIFSSLFGKVVIVTTPQTVSHSDVIRSIDFLKRLDVEILGVVENMSFYICECCNNKITIFNGDTKTNLCEKYSLPFLGQLPILPKMNEFSNSGIPYTLNYPLEQYNLLADLVLKLYQDQKIIEKFS